MISKKPLQINMSKVLFKEEQKFTQPFLWMFMIVLAGIWGWMVYRQFVTGKPVGDEPMTLGEILMAGFIPAAILIIFALLKLETEITSDEIHYRFKPFQRKFKTIRKAEIKEWHVQQYKPMRDYGGWGIRLGLAARGTAYNVKGDKGARFILHSGRQFLLGTQQPDAMKAALEKMSES